MTSFVIHGPSHLAGAIAVRGSKNAALPLLAASLLTKQLVTLRNIPDIRDVASMCSILQALGVGVDRTEEGVVRLETKSQSEQVPVETVSYLRGSILLLGALLGQRRYVRLPLPGGDIIGARPIDAHLDAFRQLGATVELNAGVVTIDGKNLAPGRVVLPEFSVTATENVLLVAATLPGTTTIELAAAEPHVVALANLLTAMGAHVAGISTHTIRITGTDALHGADYTNIPDMLEAGLFILLAAATQSQLEITDVPLADLTAFFKKIEEIGIAYTLQKRTGNTGSVHVHPSKLRGFRLQTLPHPGLATDLQAPFAVIATQADGNTLLHDPMYEGRFKHIQELQKMGADAIVCDPHRVIINGPTLLTGRRIPSLDIRSGATLIVAGLTAQGQTIIDNAEIIERGYAAIDTRLRAIGADIQIMKDA